MTERNDPTKELAGRIAFVTGAARNIGRHIAVALAKGGADVAVHTKSSVAEAEETARLVRAEGARAVVVTGDVGTPAEIEAAVAKAVEALGGLDILVNNAALRREGRIETIDYAAWREIMAATLDGAFLAARAAMPHIIARAASGGGRIVKLRAAAIVLRCAYVDGGIGGREQKGRGARRGPRRAARRGLRRRQRHAELKDGAAQRARIA